ncbi:MAG: hypothetical protein AB1586_21890 [Pseudomonadota bacterium]|jgi:hypothetical protein
MRALSFILAVAFVLGAPALAVSVAKDALPGVGTFAYSGSPAIGSAVAVTRLVTR